MEQARDLNDSLQSSDHQEDWNVSRFNQKLGSEAQNLAFMLAFVVFTAFCIMLSKISGWLTGSDPHGAFVFQWREISILILNVTLTPFGYYAYKKEVRINSSLKEIIRRRWI